MPEPHTVVVGAGLRGLAAALRLRRQQPEQQLTVIDAQPWPGDDVRTQRSNGFVCELGPIAFSRPQVEPLLRELARPPRPIECSERARVGMSFDGTVARPVAIDPPPVSFATGCEEIVQACRRELDGVLRLGRPVSGIAPGDGGRLVVRLGGEVPSELIASRVVIAVDAIAAGRLLVAFDPEFAHLTQRTTTEQRAFVFLGALARETPELRGYGMLAAEDFDSPIAEIIHCTELFPGRALAGRSLVRVETTVLPLPERDADLVEQIVAELRRWNGSAATFGFHKVHRFHTTTADGTVAECRTRVRELTSRVENLGGEPG